jgi:alpha-ribazole phosphatase
MAAIYLIRHAEPSVLGVFLGQLDPPLSAAGRMQAAGLADVSVEIVWTSPLLRAKETAGFINSPRFVEMHDLREMDQGEWTGKTWAEIEAQWSDLAARKSSDWLGIPAPGGESWTVFLHRIRAAWKQIRSGPTPAAVVAHQGVNAALAHLIDQRNPLAFAQTYGEVSELEYDPTDY